ncbi:hypothetical protein N7491_000489 [Penicillium cf. griseofulvum]|uniref:Uncharacterized protein n=1 Tax=Penicillium cf. griseofulvum TaxID=2972120 RepID=A0A9W9JQF8_9EURO|nr:hypothetical protein N7472_004149 [Penicillium cf. griseofulvum]KAJ5443239.1 hypothetical protein N7445_004352 [Penicillium cf. griseofulvum]KAJ5451307.1 hypothetical protein N7491_000489 [Penicillium cf. griseofulvum]
MIPGGAVNNTPRSFVPGFRSLVCFLKMHCIFSTLSLALFNFIILCFWYLDVGRRAAYTGDCKAIRATLIDLSFHLPGGASKVCLLSFFCPLDLPLAFII